MAVINIVKYGLSFTFDGLPLELSERGDKLLELFKPGSTNARRTPSVMISELQSALYEYKRLGLSRIESLELHSQYKSNMSKCAAARGLTIITANITANAPQPISFPSGHVITLERLNRACDALRSMIKKRGRPRKVPASWVGGRNKQQLSDRHQNFGKRNIKWTKDKNFFLICVVESTKLKYSLTKDSDALRKVANRIKRGSKQGVILGMARRLAPALTRARKSICGKKDYDEHIQLLAKKWSEEEST